MQHYSSPKSVRSIGIATSNSSHCQYRQDQAMTPEQCTQVFEAILEGKYSWACVLILKFAGYNPLHYIPYRTYKRLLKENSQKLTDRNCSTDSSIHYELSAKNYLTSTEKVLQSL